MADMAARMERQSIKTCPECGKQVYLTRRAARKSAKALYPGDHLSVYRCERGGEGWHCGHLPSGVAQGRRDRPA